MSHLLNAPIILLKDGADTSQGRGQVISNINACQVIVDIVKTTLGPRGMDKLIETDGSATITNDGATVISLLNISHPAAALLADAAKAQDMEAGDGTTSVVVLAGALLQEAREFVQEGMAPQIIIKGFRTARNIALKRIEDVQVSLAGKTPEQRRAVLERCAETSLNSKLLSGHKQFFAKMVVDAVLSLEASLEMEMVGIKKQPGGSYLDSRVIRGVAFKKTFSYAGFEQQPKKFIDPKILLLNVELELKAEKENAEVRLDNPDDYQSIVDAEWDIIYDKLDAIVKSGAQVVLSKLPIGDLATQYFAERGLFCAGRVEDKDMRRTAKATGAKVQSTVFGLTPDVLGTCGVFEEEQVGSDRYNIFSQCTAAKSATLLLRGGAPQFLDEAERSLNDALMIARRALKCNAVVAGGGAIEMDLSKVLREQSKTEFGKQQLVLRAYARALEAIPRTLTQNSGFDPTDVLNKLRQKHAAAGSEVCWYGVDCMAGGVTDCMNAFVWEPSLVTQNALAAATEAACLILSIDETVKQPNPQDKQHGAQGRM